MDTREVLHVLPEHELEMIIARLEARFIHHSHEQIEKLVRESAELLRHAPLQQFVPLLAEKRAADLLRTRAPKTPAASN